MMKQLTIGELAKLTHISKVTIRYYERAGLLPQTTRRPSGYRVYPESIIARIRFIKNAKSVGFTLEEIHELLSLQVHKNTTSQDIRQRTLKKQHAVQEKITALQKMENALKQLVASCDGMMPLHQCPILEALYAEDEHAHCHE